MNIQSTRFSPATPAAGQTQNPQPPKEQPAEPKQPAESYLTSLNSASSEYAPYVYGGIAMPAGIKVGAIAGAAIGGLLSGAGGAAIGALAGTGVGAIGAFEIGRRIGTVWNDMAGNMGAGVYSANPEAGRAVAQTLVTAAVAGITEGPVAALGVTALINGVAAYDHFVKKG